jgi:DNA (cytosine-5)-methyltransferase 1
MLTARELARAQGFSDEYILAPIHNGKPLPGYVQTSCIGNSVSPPPAEALIRANLDALDYEPVVEQYYSPLFYDEAMEA